MQTLAELGQISKAKKRDDNERQRVGGRNAFAGGAATVGGGLLVAGNSKKYDPHEMRSTAWRSSKNAYYPEVGEHVVDEPAEGYHKVNPKSAWARRAAGRTYGNPEYSAENIHLADEFKHYPKKYGRANVRNKAGAAIMLGGLGAMAAAPVIGGVNMGLNQRDRMRAKKRQ